MTPDPLGLKAAKFKRPQSLNRYIYVNNDPVNFVDPNGTDSVQANICANPANICNSVTINAIIRQNGGGGGGSSADQIEIEDSGIVTNDGGEDLAYILDMWTKALQNTTRRIKSIFDANGKCAAFFGPNAKAALDGLINSDFVIKKDGPSTTQTGISMNISPATQEDINRGFRLPVTVGDTPAVTVYLNGPVFLNPGASQLDRFGPGTDGAQMTAILHELAHLVIDPVTKAPKIPNDGTGGSSTNTETVMKECRDEVFKMVGK